MCQEGLQKVPAADTRRSPPPAPRFSPAAEPFDLAFDAFLLPAAVEDDAESFSMAFVTPFELAAPAPIELASPGAPRLRPAADPVDFDDLDLEGFALPPAMDMGESRDCGLEALAPPRGPPAAPRLRPAADPVDLRSLPPFALPPCANAIGAADEAAVGETLRAVDAAAGRSVPNTPRRKPAADPFALEELPELLLPPAALDGDLKLLAAPLLLAAWEEPQGSRWIGVAPGECSQTRTVATSKLAPKAPQLRPAADPTELDAFLLPPCALSDIREEEVYTGDDGSATPQSEKPEPVTCLLSAAAYGVFIAAGDSDDETFSSEKSQPDVVMGDEYSSERSRNSSCSSLSEDRTEDFDLVAGASPAKSTSSSASMKPVNAMQMWQRMISSCSTNASTPRGVVRERSAY